MQPRDGPPGSFAATPSVAAVVMSPRKGPVVAAVDRDLAEIAKRDKALAKSGLAASAQALARELDDRGNSATSKSMCARALAETLERLRERLPETKEKNQLDEIGARRAARRRRAAS